MRRSCPFQAHLTQNIWTSCGLQGYSGAKTNKWGDCSPKTLFRQRKLRDLGRQKNKKQKVGNVLGLSPRWGLRAWDVAGRECWVWSLGTVFPICSCTATAAPREGREGVGQECILPVGEATLPTLQLSTHRRSSEESEETRDRRSPRISAKGGTGLVTTCSPAGSC